MIKYVHINEYGSILFPIVFVAGFVVVENTSNGLSGGEITAAVFGFFALFALFGAAIYVLFRPPEALKPYILPPGNPSMGTSNGAASPASPSAASEAQGVNIENPNYVSFSKDVEEGTPDQ